VAERDTTSTESVSPAELEEQRQIDLALQKEERKDAPMTNAGCVLRAVLLMVVLMAMVMGTTYLWIASLTARRDALLATIRSSGDPMTAQEMAEFAATPEVANPNTEGYRAIFQRMRQLGGLAPGEEAIPIVGGPGVIPRPGEPWKLEALTNQYLSKRPWLDEAEALADVDEEIRIPRDYSQIDFDKFFYDDIFLTRQLIRDLKVRFHVRMRAGDRMGALRTLRGMFKLARVFDQEPDLTSQSVGVFWRTICIETTCELLRDGKATPAEIAAVRPWLDRDFSSGLIPSLKGERAAGLILLRSANDNEFSMINGSTHGMLSPVPLETKVADLRPGDTAALLEKINELIQIAEQNELPEVLTQFKLQEDQLKQMTEGEKTSLPWSRQVLVATMLPHYLSSARVVARGIAEQAALKAALDVEEKMLALGPQGRTKEAEIAAIEGILPVDPFTGQPMKYIVGDTYYRIYSAGESGSGKASGTDRQLDHGVKIERTLSTPDK
jgi:hypothetical protein